MPTYRFPINGLRYHDFKERLDELYELAPGKRMSISIEHDNAQEADAVIVYWGKKWVGYVRSGYDRELALGIIEASGRGSMLGRIVGVDRVKRWLWMEVNTDEAVTIVHEDSVNILTNWTYNDRMLPTEEAETRLQTMLCNLEMVLECQEPWDEDMEEWLEYVEENLWRDISKETSRQVSHILKLLTAGSVQHTEYAKAADRLQYAIDYMGSSEVRKLQAQQIIDKAHSTEMDVLLLYYSDTAKDAVRRLPEELVTLFRNDGEVFMGRLWYLHCFYKQIQAVKTLLAMMVRLDDDGGEDASDAIPKQWLISYAKRKENEQKADFIEQIISKYELERSQPLLAQELNEMQDACKPQDRVTVMTVDNGQQPVQMPPCLTRERGMEIYGFLINGRYIDQTTTAENFLYLMGVSGKAPSKLKPINWMNTMQQLRVMLTCAFEEPLRRGSLKLAEIERRAAACFMNKGKKIKELPKPSTEYSTELSNLECFFRPKSTCM